MAKAAKTVELEGPRPQVNVRLDPDVLKALKDRAVAEGRTPSNLAGYLVTQGMKDWKKPKG